MCTTHLHQHPCSHQTPCLTANVLSHCPKVQWLLWHYHNQPNELPLQYPLEPPQACSPYPRPDLSQQVPPPSPGGVGNRVDQGSPVTGQGEGNLRVWPVPWGCGRADNELCRVGWGNHTCPWVAGRASRGGGGCEGHGGAPMGPGAPTGPGGAAGAADAANQEIKMTTAKEDKKTTRPKELDKSVEKSKATKTTGDSTDMKASTAEESKGEEAQEQRPPGWTFPEHLKKSRNRKRTRYRANRKRGTPVGESNPTEGSEANPNLTPTETVAKEQATVAPTDEQEDGKSPADAKPEEPQPRNENEDGQGIVYAGYIFGQTVHLFGPS